MKHALLFWFALGALGCFAAWVAVCWLVSP